MVYLWNGSQDVETLASHRSCRSIGRLRDNIITCRYHRTCSSGQTEPLEDLNVLTYCMLKCLKESWTYICVFYHFSILTWQGRLKPSSGKTRTCLTSLDSQYLCWWWPGYCKEPGHQHSWYWPCSSTLLWLQYKKLLKLLNIAYKFSAILIIVIIVVVSSSWTRCLVQLPC